MATDDSTKQASASRVSTDITQLTGWAAWYATAATGSYELKVKAKADGYIDSDLSAPATLYIDSVTIDGANLAEYEGVVKILRGTAYSYTFATFSSNYTFDGVTPTVKIGGTDYTGFTWNATTGRLNIPASGTTGRIAITLRAIGKTYAVSTTLTNCTSDGAARAQYGTDYVATITADSGFNLSAEGATAPAVTIGGTSYTGFTWLPDSVGNAGTLTIPGTAITGAVAISCKAGAKSYQTVFNLTGCTTSSPDTHTAESDLSLIFLRSTGYQFDTTGKPTVTFTPDGSTDAVNISDLCTWTLPQAGFDSATLVVPKAYTVGTVTVTIAAVKQTFAVTMNITNCTITGIPSTVEYGAAAEGTVVASSGFTLNGTTPTITIGGRNYTGFTYEASEVGTYYILNIPAGAIIGDVVITLDAIGQKLATPQNVAIDGTVVSWDEVENATSYELFADGMSIGEYTVPTATPHDIKLVFKKESEGASFNYAYIKFNSSPTGENDYDYHYQADGGIVYKGSSNIGNVYSGNVTTSTITSVSIIYYWGGEQTITIGGVAADDNSYAEPKVYTVTADGNVDVMCITD